MIQLLSKMVKLDCVESAALVKWSIVRKVDDQELDLRRMKTWSRVEEPKSLKAG